MKAFSALGEVFWRNGLYSGRGTNIADLKGKGWIGDD